jgi:hypothetical protein
MENLAQRFREAEGNVDSYGHRIPDDYTPRKAFAYLVLIAVATLALIWSVTTSHAAARGVNAVFCDTEDQTLAFYQSIVVEKRPITPTLKEINQAARKTACGNPFPMMFFVDELELTQTLDHNGKIHYLYGAVVVAIGYNGKVQPSRKRLKQFFVSSVPMKETDAKPAGFDI